tara:strand:- start:133 stop:3939 length:3807 start_codon:yes stop_codon:yes gene_type:complete
MSANKKSKDIKFITKSSKSVSKKKKKKKKKKITFCPDLLKEFNSSNKTFNINIKKHQEILKCIENKNKKKLQSVDEKTRYPHLDDPNFTLKISKKKEFNEVKILKKTKKEIENIEQESNKLCNPNIEFELEPHQMFVRNFLSFETPYNSLLLFHGLGTGKTCSSISVCEEMRTYYKQIGIKKKIMIIASPVVQENYKLQLFDDRKLKKINGLWNIKACTGNKFIKEVNPMNIKDLTKEKIVKQIKKIIRQSYEFMGYIEFANKINNLIKIKKSVDENTRTKRKIYLIKKEFSNRLLVIDEVHNIRSISKNRRTTQNMLDLVSHAENMKLLLLTATPMFNDAKEIIWLANLMNLNDKRFPIEITDIFDKKGDFIMDSKGANKGKELLIQKITGYVSYVSGENPFTFPYRIWPYEAENPHSLKKLEEHSEWNYPTTQINGLEITDHMKIKYLDLVITKLSNQQQQAYNYIIEREKKKHPILNEPRQGIQYTVIDGPLQALNITYPHEDLNNKPVNIEKYLYGKNGLKRVMHYSQKIKKKFEYVEEIEKKFGRIFSSIGGHDSPLYKCSSKIYSIIKNIINNEGVTLIYSNYIDGGCVPIALALEEIGIVRYGSKDKSLFKKSPVKPMKISKKYSAKYIMITGDKLLSPNNKLELKACTHPENINGEKVKVIIISKAGSEGLDFKNIRQVHILEPWFNINRMDQIIGRAVRNKSHCSLPYNKRNVEIYLYGSQLDNDIEPIDLYVYRLAEYKSIRIGLITRILKENAIDCLINYNQQNMISTKINKTVNLILSSGKKINFNIGYKTNSIICDFMDCEYSCLPNKIFDDEITTNTYTENYIIMNIEKILQRIKKLYKEQYIYEKEDLKSRINAIKNYSDEQINMALDVLINDKNEYISDMLNRLGNLVNIGQYYLYQPLDIEDKHITLLERKKPLDLKIKTISFQLSKNLPENKSKDVRKIEDSNYIYTLQEQFKKLYKPSKITKKKDWVQTAAWAIYNLNKYNKFDMDQLVLYGLEHLFDILSINKKILILNNLYQKTNLDNKFKNALTTLINKYKLQIKKNIGFACADYKKLHNKVGYTIILLDTTTKPPTWKISDIIPTSLGRLLFSKFKIKDTNLYSDLIGFLTLPSNSQNIVFKTKKTILESGKRTNKGQRCPSAGENRLVTYARINKLAQNFKKEIKYSLELKNKKRTSSQKIKSIYGSTDVDQKFSIPEKKNKKNIVAISETQLCIETELLLRHLDQNNINNKRWFFGTLEDSINKISDIKIEKI